MRTIKGLQAISKVAFCKFFWKSDLVICCVSTLPLNLLLSDDSVKGLSTNKFMFSLMATLFSYSSVYTLLTKKTVQNKIIALPCYQWVYVSFFGSIIYSFATTVVGSLIWNLQYKKERTVLEFILDLFPNMATGFFLVAVFAVSMTIIPVVIARMILATLLHLRKVRAVPSEI